ncbi:hypothetical protein HPG69_004742, partial [Diceros bicornis minor]
MLLEFFINIYSSYREGKAILDQGCGIVKPLGYGFVKFTDEFTDENQGAVGLGSKLALLSMAIPKESHVKPVEYSQMYSYNYNQCYQQYQKYHPRWGCDQNTFTR